MNIAQIGIDLRPLLSKLSKSESAARCPSFECTSMVEQQTRLGMSLKIAKSQYEETKFSAKLMPVFSIDKYYLIHYKGCCEAKNKILSSI